MIKYLRDISERIKLLLSGMKTHSALWIGQPESEVTVEAKLKILEDKETEIINTKELLSRLSAEARMLQVELGNFADGIENLARGLHKDTPEKLAEYGIAYGKPRKHSSPPAMVLTVVLKDDTDGEGFIVSVQKADPDAENYEFEKGISTNPADINHIPAMSHLKITSKMSFVDNDIIKGSRYWYRVRPINRKGVGPWSEATSRVQ